MSKTRSAGLNKARGLTNDEIIKILEEAIKQFTDKDVSKVADIGSFELMSREDAFELYDEDEDDHPE